ncbi:MAG: hypothetical protein KC621_20015 [Myxococcales bacterium]|nr:hypothetical protein [Myxococcales bacterium]
MLLTGAGSSAGTAIDAIPGVRVAATAVAFPTDVDPGAPDLDNAGVFRAVLGDAAPPDWTPEQAEARWGARRRQWVALPGQTPSIGATDLATEAARRALAAAGLGVGDVDLVVVATSTPDRLTASLSARVCRALGTSCGSVDVRAGGACGLHAWLTAAAWLRFGPRVALVVASEVGTPLLDPADLSAWLVYGDGAAAMVLVRDDEGDAGLIGARLGTFAAPGRAFTVPGPLPPTREAVEGRAYTWQKPDRTYLEALDGQWRRTCAGLAEAFPDVAIDAFAPYRATRAQVEAAAAAVRVPLERTAADVGSHGCVGGVGPLLGVHELRERGLLGPGQVLATAAVAGGVVWHAALWRC